MGEYNYVFDEIAAIKEACGDARLKVILETGELGNYDDIRRASYLSMLAGADFIKTSTGKVTVNATLPITLLMLEAVRDWYALTGTKIGVKPAGGIRTAKDALRYLVLVKEIAGETWLDPDLFRFGASSLLNDVLMQRQKLRHPRLGQIGPGGPGFDSTDTVVGLTFSVPLQRRTARGAVQRAEAELRETELRQRRIADQITTEVGNILVNLNTALKQADLADAEVKQANQMVQAERTRFRLGAGDFFFVNQREETAANAQIKAIRAEIAGRLAEASYNAATMNLGALGLE